MAEMKHALIDIVKGTTANLAFCRGGKLFYQVLVDDTIYTFPIDVTNLDEVGKATFELQDKTSIFMRYIRKAIDALDGNEPEDMIRWEILNN